MDVLPRTPSFDLSGKRALVIGGSKGIGFGISVALAQAGAEVTIVARSLNETNEAADLIAKTGAKAKSVQMDVTNTRELASLFEDKRVFDILVNSAGTNRPKKMTDVEPVDFDAVMALNVKATFFATQYWAKALISEKKPGSVIHIGSQMGQVGGPNRSIYCASKWALEGMNKAIALDLAPHNIRSNIIAPTFIETPMTRPFFEDKVFLDSVLNKIKLGRLGKVEDIMGAAVFLASEASGLMTGSTMLIDGGWTAE